MAHPRNESELQLLLSEHDVDTTEWGRGQAKTVLHLFTELLEGDCELVIGTEGLARRVRNVWVDVFVTVASSRQHLVERRQEFRDGRSRQRHLPASLGEKCKVGEEPETAARRGMAEELGIHSAVTLIAQDQRANPLDRPSYPTLRTVYDTHWFAAELDLSDYLPEGYVEEQQDKRTYFEWESSPDERKSSFLTNG